MGNLARLKSRSTADLLNEWKRAFGVGENDLFLETFQPFSYKNPSFPPYNIIKKDDSTFQIEMALAGFSKDEVEVTLEGNILSVSSKTKELSEESGDDNFIYRGLAKRTFRSTFRISEFSEVSDCHMRDGVLSITIAENIPEEKLPKVITIK